MKAVSAWFGLLNKSVSRPLLARGFALAFKLLLQRDEPELGASIVPAIIFGWHSCELASDTFASRPIWFVLDSRMCRGLRSNGNTLIGLVARLSILKLFLEVGRDRLKLL